MKDEFKINQLSAVLQSKFDLINKKTEYVQEADMYMLSNHFEGGYLSIAGGQQRVVLKATRRVI